MTLHDLERACKAAMQGPWHVYDRNQKGEKDMMQRFIIPGCLPGLNEMIAAAKNGRRNWQPYADMKQAHAFYIVSCIKKAKLSAVASPVMVYFTWIEANKKRDLDNIAAAKKFVIDALVSAGILGNDGWAQVVGFTDHFAVVENGMKPQVMVEVEELYGHGPDYIGTGAHYEPV